MDWKEYKQQIDALEEVEVRQLELIAELVKRRKEIGITQRELAERSGLQQSAIARLERDGVVPKVDTLTRIAKALGLKVQLVEEEAAAKI